MRVAQAPDLTGKNIRKTLSQSIIVRKHKKTCFSYILVGYMRVSSESDDRPAVCQNFGVKRNTLIDTLARIDRAYALKQVVIKLFISMLLNNSSSM